MIHPWSDPQIGSDAEDVLRLLEEAVRGLTLDSGGRQAEIQQIHWSRTEDSRALTALGASLHTSLPADDLRHVRVAAGDRHALLRALRDAPPLALLHPRLEAAVAGRDGTAIAVVRAGDVLEAAFRAGPEASHVLLAPAWAEALGQALPHDGVLVDENPAATAHGRLAQAAFALLPAALRQEIDRALERGPPGHQTFSVRVPKRLLAIRSGPFRLLWQPGGDNPARSFHGAIPD